MSRLSFTCELDGMDTNIVFTDHSLDRFIERNVNPKKIRLTLEDAAELLFTGKDGDQVVVSDWDRGITVVVIVENNFDTFEIKLIIKTLHFKGRTFIPKGRAIKIENGVASWLDPQ